MTAEPKISSYATRLEVTPWTRTNRPGVPMYRVIGIESWSRSWMPKPARGVETV